MVQMNLFAGHDKRGWTVGRLKREKIHVYISVIHLVVRQKLTQHCKAVIPQFKKSIDTIMFPVKVPGEAFSVPLLLLFFF